MVTLPTSIVTINANGKIFKLEVHNWYQEIILRNRFLTFWSKPYEI
ncbi:hypothetical protein KARL1_93 [Acinetobacter phage KARL-1]|uniref:Uncharacterized protein n=1 Tax=Acinetobacter phage KARL-1 TaxID=2301662 RepID=A0A385IIK4_9CAUD|nr:hypothetical protein HYP70_gp093 [Acinetobacter phage KARL-1]AXY82712.1 hypothetical protein KARL1_93 [Acinetobacter phage KARL-1]